jgi:hypothetical protein
VQRVRAGITKVRKDFFDTEFHDGTQVDEANTRDHKNLTAPRVLCNNTHCSKSDDNKKKDFLMTMYDDKHDVTSMMENLITTCDHNDQSEV